MADLRAKRPFDHMPLGDIVAQDTNASRIQELVLAGLGGSIRIRLLYGTMWALYSPPSSTFAFEVTGDEEAFALLDSRS